MKRIILGTLSVLVVMLFSAAAFAIGTADIDDGAVTTPKIANNAVTTQKIAPGAIGNARLADGAVNSAKIKNGSIRGEDLGPNVVDTTKIADGAVTDAKITGPIDSAKIPHSHDTSGTIIYGAQDVHHDIATGITTTTHFTGSYYYKSGAGQSYSRISLSDIPDGAIITSVVCYVTDSSAIDRIATNIHRANVDGTGTNITSWCYSGPTNCANDDTFAGGATTLTPSIGSGITIDRSTYSYTISIWTSDVACGSSCRFHSCVVDYSSSL